MPARVSDSRGLKHLRHPDQVVRVATLTDPYGLIWAVLVMRALNVGLRVSGKRRQSRVVTAALTRGTRYRRLCPWKRPWAYAARCAQIICSSASASTSTSAPRGNGTACRTWTCCNATQTQTGARLAQSRGSGQHRAQGTCRKYNPPNGDDVTATGLFVEHFQKYNVIWNGNGGEVIFFQSELPYDPPTQADYEHDGVLGYAAFKVADNVQSFQGYGMGSYISTNVNPDIHVSYAFEVPSTPGVQMNDLLAINLSGPSTIDHVINDTGGPVSSANPDVASQVVSYP